MVTRSGGKKTKLRAALYLRLSVDNDMPAWNTQDAMTSRSFENTSTAG